MIRAIGYNNSQITESFLEMVDHISHLDYQERVWIKVSGPDFDEIVCLFLGEGDPILENYKDFNITKGQYSLLKGLKN